MTQTYSKIPIFLPTEVSVLGAAVQCSGDFKTARKYFEAAVLADSGHSAAWHGWAQLEMKQNRLIEARNILMSGIRNARTPNAYLYESVANLACDVGLVDEARYWFREGTTQTEMAESHALWVSWGNMEWKLAQDHELAQYCFAKALKINKRSRYVHLSWATLERELGRHDRSKLLLEAGMELNPTDGALRQVCCLIYGACTWLNSLTSVDVVGQYGVEACPGPRARAVLLYKGAKDQQAKPVCVSVVSNSPERARAA
jgi:tetratricopeptide (TPR) repeat protein